MPDKRVVAKAMNDLADEWHWVVLHDAEEVESGLYATSQVVTLCGLLISGVPRRVRLFDMGAPDTPTCRACLDGGSEEGLSEGLVKEIEQVLEGAGTPAG